MESVFSECVLKPRTGTFMAQGEEKTLYLLPGASVLVIISCDPFNLRGTLLSVIGFTFERWEHEVPRDLLIPQILIECFVPGTVLGPSALSKVPGGNKCLTTVVVVQLLSHVGLSATPSTAMHQASPSLTISRSLLKLIPLSR